MIKAKVSDDMIAAFVSSYIDGHGYSPSVRDICANFECSPSTVKRHLDRMRDLGVIDFTDRTPRTIRVLSK